MSRPPGTIDLRRQADVRIDGAAGGDRVGVSLARAGDVNGDGLADLLVGAPYADNNARDDSGSAYVLFGKADPGRIDLAKVGEGGFRIDGADGADFDVGRGSAVASVAGAGDVNGDGLADMLVGASLADTYGRDDSGSAYVVLGKTDAGDVDLAALGQGGFPIDGAAAHDIAGSSVAGAGDVNGDGRADLLVGAPSADNNGRASSGSTYLIFGKADAGRVDLAELGLRGFRIDGAGGAHLEGKVDGDEAGDSVAAAGDVNGDGLADVLVGAPNADNNGRGDSGYSGSAYVIFGKANAGRVDLLKLGRGGFRIDGATADGGDAGASVAGAGDVNGDRRADVLVGAPGDFNNALRPSGSGYLVFRKSSARKVELARLRRAGVPFDGAADGDKVGVSVAGVGDVNGDGRADVLVGAPGVGNNGRRDSGSA